MSTYLPTIKQLQYLVALHEHGHFGKAADASFVSQSTLSAGIRELESLLGRLHAIVLGPGLGRSESMQAFARDTLRLARDKGLFVVLDADALWTVQQAPGVIKGYARAVLTPNRVEFSRLCDALVRSISPHPRDLAELGRAWLRTRQQTQRRASVRPSAA